MAAETFENETPVEGEEDAETFELRATRPKKKGKDGEQIESDTHIPLFPDWDKTASNVIHELQIFKTSGPDDGFKGSVVPSTTLLQIARLFGNGVFNIHAVRADGKVLRRTQNVKIDTPDMIRNPPRAEPGKTAAPVDLTLLSFQREAHEKDSARMADMAKDASAQSRAQSSEHVKMVQETSTASSQRDREFFAGMMTNQQQFFGSMLTQQQQAHAQQMEIMRFNAEQERLRQEHSHQQQLQANNPATLLTLFRQGLELGQGLGGDDQSPLNVIANTVGNGLKEVRGMMALKALSNRPAARTLPAKTATSVPNPGRSKPAPQADPASIPPMEKLLQFQQLAAQKGLTVPDLLDDLVKQMKELPDRELDELEDTDELEDEEDESTSADGESETSSA